MGQFDNFLLNQRSKKTYQLAGLFHLGSGFARGSAGVTGLVDSGGNSKGSKGLDLKSE